jgi:hypothetical protein
MNGFEAYVTYNSFKLHFKQPKYDFFLYQGKTRLTIQSYEKRKDRYQFEKIASRYSLEKFLMKLLVAQKSNQNFWIGDVITKQNEDEYLIWKGYLEGFKTYFFADDISKIKTLMMTSEKSFGDLIDIENQIHPLFFKMLIRKAITPETFICLDQVLGFCEKMNNRKEEDSIWADYFFFLTKYYPFVSQYFPPIDNIRKITESLWSI